MRKSPVSDLLFVVLVGARNPLNIGAAARAMSNFGFTNLRLVNPFALAFREAKSAVGASAVLKRAQEYKTISDAVADCSLVVGTTAARNRKLDHDLRLLQQGAGLIRHQLHSGNVALLFGSEKRGLSNRDLSYCHWLMRIPTCEPNPSMNLGQAVAVCLYELARDQTLIHKRQTRSTASSADVDRLTLLLLDSLRTSGYMKPTSTVATEEKIRRLLRRLNLSLDDAHLLEGMLRQILWKMHSPAN
jgi:TrmH family RNA methyltransferase